MFVARYSLDPKYDLRRMWVGYMHPQGKTRREVADVLLDTNAVNVPFDYRASSAAWERGIRWVLKNVDIRYHRRAGAWLRVHHARGLSCWPLEAETAQEAVAEAARLDAEGLIFWHGWGKVTVGRVRYVAPVTDELHVFECEDVETERQGGASA